MTGEAKLRHRDIKIDSLVNKIKSMETTNQLLRNKFETRMTELHEVEAVVGDIYSILVNYYNDN